jgi:hypothetical protein
LCEHIDIDPVTLEVILDDVDKEKCGPGDWTVVIKGCMGDKCDDVEIDIPIRDPCATASVTLGANPFPAYTGRRLGEDGESLNWSNIDIASKDTDADCGPVVITITNKDGTPIDPDLFTDTRNGDETDNNLNIAKTNDPTKVGTYDLVYKVCYRDMPPESCKTSNDIRVEITDPCKKPTSFIPSTTENEEDDYSGFEISFVVDKYTIEPDFCEVEYSCESVTHATMSDWNDANPDGCDIFDLSGPINGAPFGVSTLSAEFTSDQYLDGTRPPGVYNIRVKGVAKGSDPVMEEYTDFTLTLIDPCDAPKALKAQTTPK